MAPAIDGQPALDLDQSLAQAREALFDLAPQPLLILVDEREHNELAVDQLDRIALVIGQACAPVCGQAGGKAGHHQAAPTRDPPG